MARVMMVLRPSKGGAWKNAATLAGELVRRGHTVALCGPHSERRSEVPGVEIISLRIERPVSPARDLWTVARFAQLAQRWHPDLIHAHGSKGGVIARVARIAQPRTPVVFTPHQLAFANWFAGTKSRVGYRVIERTLAPLASRVLCVCEDEKRLVAELGIGRKARVVYNGIDPPAPASPDPMVRPLDGGASIILAVAELHRRKGLATLVDAMPTVLDSRPDAAMMIAGDGPERASLAAQIHARGLSDRIHLLGQVEDISAVHAAANVFVNPAWAEAFPYAIIEAMAAAMPIVATDVGGCGEAIEDGVTGRLIPPRNPMALAQAVLTLLGDGAEAERLGRKAKERMLARFTTDAMVRGTLSVYEELGIGD